VSRIAATLGFLSPQQALGERATVLDDVYGLGATIYDLLTGTPPFYKGQVLAQVCERKPQTMAERLAELGIADSVSLVLEDTVAMCLEKEPAKRPPNIAAVLQLLERSEVPARHADVGETEKGKEKADAEAHPEQNRDEVQPAGEEEQGPEISEPEADQSSLQALEAAQVQASEESQVTEPEAVLDHGSAYDDLRAPSAAKPLVKQSTFALASIVGVVLVIALGLWLVGKRGLAAGKAARVGTLDVQFAPTTNANNEIRAAVVQSDKKILVGGMFTQLGDGTHKSLARLNADGSVDDSFTGTTGGDVHAMALQPDGHILIAGEFSKVNDSTRRRIARLNPDGSLDETFRPTAGANRDVRAILLQPDGKILIAGGFDASSGKRLNRIGRFNPDGTRDNTFDPGFGAPAMVWSLALQRDNKIIAGGDFTTFNHQAYCRIVRLGSDGKIDPSFNVGSGADGQVYAVAVQADGKILIGGDFTRINEVQRNHVARLNADGTLDKSFNPGSGTDSGVRCLAAQADGKILIGGIFTNVQGVARNRIARLKPDGPLDGSFDPGEGVNEVVRWIGMEADGGVLIAGAFTKCAGVERMRIARLKGG
jgi:uncharacterized delta-60 repeat protein